MRTIFVNLPVEDVTASRAFFTSLGFSFNDQFSDNSAACLVVEENISVMLLARSRFADFVNGEIADAFATTEVLTCLSAGSRAEVDDLLARALEAGATPWKPTTDAGPMYGASFQDLDGHVWELVHMDLSGAHA